MPSGCCVCNPMCGKCQPAPFKSVSCAQCGSLNIFTKNDIVGTEPLLCAKCGQDLSKSLRPRPVFCNHSGMACAYPCGRHNVPRSPSGYLPCARNTPPRPKKAQQQTQR